MPTIHLTAGAAGGAELLATAGAYVHLPEFRLYVWVYLGGIGTMERAVFDTGASTCILPSRFWLPLHRRGAITWLTGDPAHFAGSGQAADIAVQGDRYPFRLGRVALELLGVGGSSKMEKLSSQDVLVICTYDLPSEPPAEQLPLVIGLADVVHGRTLQLEASSDGSRWAATLTES